MKQRPPLSIVIDEQEQRPWSWERHQVQTTVRKLTEGDYALEVETHEIPGRKSLAVDFSIERKGFDDFLGTIASGWERFLRELARMEEANFPARVIIVEGAFSRCCFTVDTDGKSIAPTHNHPQLSANFVAKRIAQLTLMGVSVIFAEDAMYAAALAYRIFRERATSIQPIGEIRAGLEVKESVPCPLQ